MKMGKERKIKLLKIARKQAKEKLKKLEKEKYHYITEISKENLRLQIQAIQKELYKLKNEKV